MYPITPLSMLTCLTIVLSTEHAKIGYSILNLERSLANFPVLVNAKISSTPASLAMLQAVVMRVSVVLILTP